MKTDKEKEIAEDRADWLVDAVAMSTQDRQFLRGEDVENIVATEAIYENAKKAILVALKWSRGEEWTE